MSKDQQLKQIMSSVLSLDFDFTEGMQSLEAVLSTASRADLGEWIRSPFAEYIIGCLKEAIGLNMLDMAQGNIELRTKESDGLMYRSQESLRGGIVALVGALWLFDELQQITGSAIPKKEDIDGRQG